MPIIVLERFRAGAFLRTLAQRDLAAPDEIVGDLERERRATNVEYERIQGANRQLNPAGDRKKIDEDLARLVELRQKQARIATQIQTGIAEVRRPEVPATPGPRGDTGGARSGSAPAVLLGRRSEELPLRRLQRRQARPASLGLCAAGRREGPSRVGGCLSPAHIEGRCPASSLARSRSLYDLLLKPAETLIGPSDRLLIVPDGPLNTLPWAALARERPGSRPGIWPSGSPSPPSSPPPSTRS